MSHTARKETATFELGDVELQSGEVLKEAKIAYATYGKLSADRDNVIVTPAAYAGSHEGNEYLFGQGRAIDPARHFIVAPNLFGNGLSSSPSLASAGQEARRFPGTTIHDAVRCQYRLLNEAFGIERIRLVAGYSMGGCQAFEFAAQYPEMIDAILPCAGAAKTSVHNDLFLKSMESVLRADPSFNNGEYSTLPVAGLSAFGRAWCPWAYSQGFFRDGGHRQLGFSSLDDLLDFWASMHLSLDANDLLHQLHSWQCADISANPTYSGDSNAALSAISAQAIVIPISTDMYFRVEDNRHEVAQMRNAELRVFESVWGHSAGIRNNDSKFQSFFDNAAAELLSLT